MARMLARVALLFGALLPVVASGQYYDWGRSPQGMRWMQAKLPSGKVVFPDYYSDNAARVARYLDTIRPSISYGFEYAPLKMPVVLHTENFVANGMAMWAPKRIELEMIPDAQPFAEPWLKHLVTHEYRHAVQYGNLYRRFMKGLGYVLGQQAGFVSSVLVPVWFLEGDAVMAETQMSSFGRALQPSFTVEYRAYLTGGKQRFPLDKWFCGSYRNYIPDHYQFGYQLVAWSRERYGDDMWSRVADYGARRPYTILTTKWALRKYYRTSVNRIARSTLDDLTRFWRSQPVEPNSASILPTPLTSYTVYRSPMRLDGSTLLALKKDMDRPNRLVAVDLATGRERRIAWTGSVNTPPVLGDSVIYWSEYRSSTLWEQRVFSVACRYDLRTGRRKTLRKRGNALYPTPLPGGRLVTVGYDYTGQYLLDRGDGRRFPFPRTMSVHGLAYDSLTRTLAFIGLDDEGMSIGAIDPESGAIRTLLKPSYVSIYNLRAGAGLLSFNSIQSGKDEIHLYDLRAGRQYRLSRSRYGSLSPSAPEADSLYYFTTYTLDGYRLSTQRATADSLVEVEYSELPVDRVNPPRRKWDVMNIDTVDVSFEFAEGTPVKRFRKGTHLFNVHSWAPWDFDPVKVTSETRFNVGVGATVMSQDLLSSTTAYLAYGYVGGGTSQLRGALNYYGLAPKFELGFNYGGGWQSLYGFLSEEQVPRRKKYFDLSLKVSLPMTLSSGYHTRTLTPYAELRHINALIWENDRSETGYQRLVAGLLFSDNVRMATRDFLPRWGYALRFSTVSAPFRGGFGRILSLYGRVYLPGLMPHHSLMLRGNLQRQTASDYMFYYKELYPRGAGYDYVASRYASVTADYQFPVWCPDGGINSIVYFTRIRMNLYFDCARYQEKRATMAGPYYPMRSVNSYGGEILFDMHPLRIPAKEATLGVYVYKPGDRSGVVTGIHFSLPL
ncbi:hypothetical protein [Alistipes ihumii]|uniref:hypothetical protein n=1 Tax=Alistipes ihumii TaxID=1470347 RepID=UPI00307B12F1